MLLSVLQEKVPLDTIILMVFVRSWSVGTVFRWGAPDFQKII